jgi:hypothetical protein
VSFTQKWLQTPWNNDPATAWYAPNSNTFWINNPWVSRDNVFVGFSLLSSDFDPVWAPAALYRGTTDVDLGVSGHALINLPGIDAGHPFTLKTPIASSSGQTYVGKPTYDHHANSSVRTAAVKGYSL